MANLAFNPFQTIDILVPEELHDEFTRYCQRSTGSSGIDQSPFPRMVDMWFLAVSIAARLDLAPVMDVPKNRTVKIIDGSIFSSDPWRIHTLMLIVIAKTEDLTIASDARGMMAILSGLAVAGIPKLVEMLKEGQGEPIWNLSDALFNMLEDKDAA